MLKSMPQKNQRTKSVSGFLLMNHQEGASSLGATQWLSMQYAKMPANYMSRSLKQLLATPVWCMNHEIRMF